MDPLNQSSFIAKKSFVVELHAQFAESDKLEQAINANLRAMNLGGGE